jgi:4-amino-4-deoxy-L-arabinose transferase-like glycosyltransferase
MHTKHTPFYLLIASLILAMLIAKLVSCGMFIDGMLYNSVAHNLAHHRGTFWFPFFSKNTMLFFHEQPPLTFWIESLFYRILGDGLWVDAAYSLFTALIGGFILYKIWETVTGKKYSTFAWLPLLFWLLIPTVTWAYSNCMEENTMSMFVLIAVWLQCKVIYQNKAIYYTFLAGLSLVLASLCKGFPGLFPLGFMGFAWLTQQISFKKASLNTFLIISVLLICYTTLYLYPPSYQSLSTYLTERVFNSIKNVSTEGNRFWIISRALGELASGILIAIAIRIIHRRSYQSLFTFSEDKKGLLFAILALSGTVPLMATLEQRGFYLATAMPYFALSFAFFTLPAAEHWLQNATEKWTKIATKISGILVFIALIWVATKLNTYRKTEEQWVDYFIFKKEIPPNTEVSIPSEMWEDWDLHCALNRLSFIILNGNSLNENSNNSLINNSLINNSLIYFITKKESKYTVPEHYKLQNLPTKYYDLYKKQPEK